MNILRANKEARCHLSGVNTSDTNIQSLTKEDYVCRWTSVCSVLKIGRLPGAVPMLSALAIEMNFGFKTLFVDL